MMLQLCNMFFRIVRTEAFSQRVISWYLIEGSVTFDDRSKLHVLKCMPACVPGNRQLTLSESNESRIVTKVRWVIESINGHLKNKFKNIGNVCRNASLENTYKDIKIACALLNKYGTRLYSDRNNDEMIIDQVRIRRNKENLLFNLVNSEDLNRRTVGFTRYDRHARQAFPILNYDALYKIAIGSYQIKNCSIIFFYCRATGGLCIRDTYRNLNSANYNIKGS